MVTLPEGFEHMKEDVRLQDLLLQAAEQGAGIALSRVGLGDEEAGKDLLELRSALKTYKAVRGTAVKTAVQWATVGILGGITFAISTKLHLIP